MNFISYTRQNQRKYEFCCVRKIKLRRFCMVWSYWTSKNSTHRIQRTDTDMAHSVIILFINVFKRPEVFQRAADSIGEVIDFCDALAHLACSTEQERLMDNMFFPFQKCLVDSTGDISSWLLYWLKFSYKDIRICSNPRNNLSKIADIREITLLLLADIREKIEYIILNPQIFVPKKCH